MGTHLQQHCHPLDEPALSPLGLAPQIHDRKGKMRVILLLLFVKALGYFLLLSFFFPEQEFVSPHGFLVGEVGEKSQGCTAGFQPHFCSPGCSSCIAPPNLN